MRFARTPLIRALSLASLSVALGAVTLPVQAANAAHAHAHAHAQDHSNAKQNATAARQQATEHTQALIALQKRWAKAQGAEKSKALEQMIAKAEERRGVLHELIKSNPAEVLRVAIPDDKQAQMPPEVAQKLEQKLELSGQLEMFYEDYEDGSHRLHHRLNTPFGERFELHIAGHATELVHGRAVTLTGVLLENTADDNTSDGDVALSEEALMLAAGSETTSSGMLAALSNTFGEQKALVVNVNFSNNTSQPWTRAQAQELVFGSVNDFIRENSFNQTWLTGAVTPWLTLPLSSGSCDTSAILQASEQAAAAAGYNLANYSRRIYMMPYNSNCPFSGVGSVGGAPSSSLINGSLQLYTVAHELGHNLGLYHSHALECGASVIGSNCSSDEYGDGVDIMGRVAGHYSAFQKERLGWLNSSNTLTLSNSGLYDLGGYAAQTGTAPKALKISKGTDSSSGQPAWYYVEYRQATGFDNIFAGNTNVQNGVVVHTGISNRGDTSFMLDMTPGSGGSNYTDTRDPALEVGRSFTDASAAITLATESVDGTKARVNVQLPGSTASCTRANPTMSLTPGESAWVAGGTSYTYSLTLTNRDSSTCGSNSFSLSKSTPSGWSSAFGSNTLTMAPGESRTTSLTVTSSSSANDGFYNITASANSSGYSASRSVTYVVDNPVTPTNSAPTARADSTSTAYGTAVTIGVLGNDTDPDGDALSVTSVSGVNGSAVINANGTIRFTPANGFSGIETFSYSISDGKGGSDSATVSVSVAAQEPVSTNKAPIANDDTVTLNSITSVTIPVLANDSDPEGATLKVVAVTQGSKGDVRINANGTLTYTPGKPFKSDDSFTYTISDGDKTATANVFIRLLDANTGSGSTGNGNGNGKGNKP